jgi:hypothetical protein
MRDKLEDLDFSDDVCLLAQRIRDMEEKLRRLKRLRLLGLMSTLIESKRCD